MASPIFKLTLPVLGQRDVTPHPREAGHFLWFDTFGAHDCSPKEDAFITEHLSTKTTDKSKPCGYGGYCTLYRCSVGFRCLKDIEADER